MSFCLGRLQNLMNGCFMASHLLEMKALDAYILAKLVTNDDPVQAYQAASLIEGCCAARTHWISPRKISRVLISLMPCTMPV